MGPGQIRVTDIYDKYTKYMILDGLALFAKALQYENSLFKTRHIHKTKWNLAANAVGESFSKDLCKLSPNNVEVAHITRKMTITWVKYISTMNINSSHDDEFSVCVYINQLVTDADWSKHYQTIGTAFQTDFTKRCPEGAKYGMYMNTLWIKYVQHIVPQLTHVQLYLSPIPPQFNIHDTFKSTKVIDAFHYYIKLILNKPSNQGNITKIMDKILADLQIRFPQRPEKMYEDACMDVFRSKHVDKFREWYAVQTEIDTYSDEEDIGELIRQRRACVEETFDYSMCEKSNKKGDDLEHAYFETQS